MNGLRDKPVGRPRPGTIKDDPFSPFPNPLAQIDQHGPALSVIGPFPNFPYGQIPAAV